MSDRRAISGDFGRSPQIARWTKTEGRAKAGGLPIGNAVARPDVGRFAPDYAELNLKDFSNMLEEINDLTLLAGIANRRKVLNAPNLKRYSDDQRNLILSRKYEIQRKMKK